ncbi:hypothetical protein [Nitrosopumilus sp.]|uniref:hypothetical protein n=1 Tax=Nitrosopumilus sp. TaxID=2024843 RepID=UPI00292CD8B5|nr:hypothetical protein [Nitrosopumilus sp.]
MIEEDNMIEESNVISIDEIIVEETVEEPIAEEITIEEEIIEPIIIESVEEITEEIITDKETTNSNLSLDKSITLVILLSVVFGGVFVYYKKFRNSNKILRNHLLRITTLSSTKLFILTTKLQSKSKKNQNRIFSSV